MMVPLGNVVDTLLRQGLFVYLSVCPSVCLSVCETDLSLNIFDLLHGSIGPLMRESDSRVFGKINLTCTKSAQNS